LPTTSPAVSVCIPVYNGERFLAETVRSVLDQTYRDFELVLLDNASTDHTAEIAASFTDPRIRIERNPTTVPQTVNFNRVVEHCRAPLIKLVCADDLVHPQCLEFQAVPMQADPEIALVAGRRHMIDENSRVIAPRRGMTGLTGVHSGAEVVRRVVRNGGNPIGEPAGAMFRNDDFQAVGGWQAGNPYLLDLDLWIRLLQRGKFLGLRQTLAAFRIGSTSVSATGDRAMYDAHRAFVNELTAAPEFAVRTVDRLVGRMSTPAARLRRRTLYRISGLARPELTRKGSAS
jgi:glycosyltransferase involved in cell wall biosynthesis